MNLRKKHMYNVPKKFIVSIAIKFSVKCIKYFLITKNHYHWQQIMANSTSSYAKKLKDGTINQVVSDLNMAKGNSGRAN